MESILSNNLEIGKKINSALFPGIQGGPLEHVIAGKAQAFMKIYSHSLLITLNRVVKMLRQWPKYLMNQKIFV